MHTMFCPCLFCGRLLVLTQPEVEDGAEDLGHGHVLELGECDVVEVSHEAGSHGVTTTPWGTHGTHVVHVHQTTEVTCHQT